MSNDKKLKVAIIGVGNIKHDRSTYFGIIAIGEDLLLDFDGLPQIFPFLGFCSLQAFQ